MSTRKTRYSGPSATAANLKISDAQNLVEEAQTLLSRAAGQLSSLRGGTKEFDRLSKLHDQVHAAWYRVGNLTGYATLDHEPRVDCKCGCSIVTKKQQQPSPAGPEVRA